jgi:hypothetical protein
MKTFTAKHNIGAYFVIDLDLRKIVGQHQHYKTALNQYKRSGGYGKATIIPAADALLWQFNADVENFSTKRPDTNHHSTTRL